MMMRTNYKSSILKLTSLAVLLNCSVVALCQVSPVREVTEDEITANRASADNYVLKARAFKES